MLIQILTMVSAGVLLAGGKIDLPMPPPPTPRAKPAVRQEPIKLAIPGLSFVNVDPGVGEFFTEYLAQKLSAEGIRVTTAKDISSVIGFERQRQMMGCNEGSTSCLAELAGALGVDGLVSGSIAKIGNEFAITLNVISARDGSSMASANERFVSEQRLLDWLNRVAKPLSARLRVQMRGETLDAALLELPTEPKGPKPADARDLSWIAFAGAGALAIGGGASYGLARMKEGQLRNGAGVDTEKALDGALGDMKLMESAGYGLFGAALVAAAIGGGMFLFGGPPETASTPVRAALVGGDGAVGIVVFGRLP